MNVNSRSEAVWQILHQSKALLTQAGFADPSPALPAAHSRPAEGYEDLAAKYGENLAFGATWPTGSGPANPQALILTDAPLSTEALAFMRTWFENSKVNLVVADLFFIQPLPVFEADKPPYQALARELCSLMTPKVVLSLGPGPAQKLLGAPLSLESLRGADYRFDKWTIITTLNPEHFLTLPEEEKARFKSQVWKDLQRLLGKLRYG